MIELDLEGLQKHREQTVLDILELLKKHTKRYQEYSKRNSLITKVIYILLEISSE